LFAYLALPALEQVLGRGPGGRSYVSLSGLLQVCAYLYETGAVLGRSNRDTLSELVSLSFAADEIHHCLAEVETLLMRRLETSGQYAHSFYTFYLHGTMRDMDMEFDVKAMKEAHRIYRDKTQADDFMKYAGAEGLLLGGWYPDLAEKMYASGFGQQESVIREMTKNVGVLPEETSVRSIHDRERLVLSRVSEYLSRHAPGHRDVLKFAGDEE